MMHSEELDYPEIPSSFAQLVDPTEAIRAAQRLYDAGGRGILHSDWGTRPTSRKRITETETEHEDVDLD